VRRWSDLVAEAPDLARAGHRLLTQFGPGLGFLATVRPDGGARIHPVCPIVVGDGLWVFVVAGSPKQADLRANGQYALHSFPCPDVDDELMVAGAARVEEDPAVVAPVLEAYLAQGTTSTGDETLFELHLERALHAAYGPRPSWPPRYERWRAG
jgi:hypothetical protein